MPPHHHGGGFRGGARFGGGGYFAPASYLYPPTYYAEPEYVPVFIVEDEEDKRRRAELEQKKKRATAASGLGILSPRRGAHAMRGFGDIVFGSKTSDPTVLACQQYLNPILVSRGYLPIGVDGELGKATCGAVAWLMQGGASDYDKGVYFDMNAIPQSVWQVWNVCASSSQEPPTPATAAAKTSSYNVAVTKIAATPVNAEAVMDAQRALNVALAAAGMCAIDVDGDAGSGTCGAQTWLIANAGGDGLTQTQRDAISLKCSTSKKTAPSVCAKPVVIAPPTPAPAPVVPVPMPPAPKPKMSTAAMVAGVGLAAAVTAGLYTYFKHKGK